MTQIIIETMEDAIPEFQTWFLVNLTSVSNGACIMQANSFVNITMEASDYPSGKFAFSSNSRFVVIQLVYLGKSRGNRRSTAQRMKFSVKDFLNKCEQIRSKLQICSHLLKKFLTENFIFCVVQVAFLHRNHL